MEEKLEEKQTKKEWMAKIVHELRTPVNGILGLTEELLKTDITPFQKEDADILGLKPTAISNYESKRNEPSFEKLIALSKYKKRIN